MVNRVFFFFEFCQQQKFHLHHKNIPEMENQEREKKISIKKRIKSKQIFWEGKKILFSSFFF